MVTFITPPAEWPNSALMELVCTLNSAMASGGGPITYVAPAGQPRLKVAVVDAVEHVIVLVGPNAVGAETAGPASLALQTSLEPRTFDSTAGRVT